MSDLNLSLERFRFGRSLTIATLVALGAGIAAGALAPPPGTGAIDGFARVAEVLGSGWIRALRMVVLPLVVSLLVVSIVGTRERGGVARMGGAAIGIFVAIYLALAVLSALLYPPLIRLFRVPRGALATLRDAATDGTQAEALADLDVVEWLLQAIPTNPFAAAAEENILQLVVFTLVFALAVGKLAPEARGAVSAFFSPVAEAMLVIVAWLINASPLPVFALAFAAARETGFGAAWVLLAFAAMTTVIMLLATAGLIPLAGILGRVGTLRFFRAVWPGQVVALATRSSLATVPALVEGAKTRLGLTERVVGFGLPLAASMFKPNRLVSSPGKLLFMAWIFEIPLEPMGYAMFVGYVMLTATTSLGVPNQGTRMTTLPAYLALGMPIEGYILVQSVDMLWDYAATVLNATGYLASTALLPRAPEAAAAPEPLPEPAG